jgi:UrcA family protein
LRHLCQQISASPGWAFDTRIPEDWMNRIFATLAFTALALTQVALAANTSIAVEGMAPTRDNAFVLRRSVVQYGDLNTAEAQGAAALRTRLEQAANAVCKGHNTQTSTQLAQQVEQCRVKALNAAVEKAGLPK